MPPVRRRFELSVERPLGARGPPGAVARLAASFEPGPAGEGPTDAELASALEQILQGLAKLAGIPEAGASVGARPDRELSELFETYRPRGRELVDLLLADGELTPGEHQRLVASLGSPRAEPEPAPGEETDLTRVGETPIAAVPLSAERRLPPARPVPELLRTFQIASLRQAGAVRARRQISFAEYMALKKHFESAGPSEAKAAPPPGGPG